MKKNLLTVFVCLLTLGLNAQKASVEESTYGLQTGFLGFWFHEEKKLSNEIALRGEVGFDSRVSGGSLYDGLRFIFTPVITLEPRWYYNLNKRLSKSKKIDGNSGNFVSIKVSYNPDWFTISNQDNLRVIDQISIVPTWGIRRNIGKHFTYEAGIGLGYRYIFSKNAGFADNDSEGVLNLHLRIGYRF